MKLELKHLAPYLPYGLKGIDYDKKTYYFIGLDNVGNIHWDCNEVLNKKGYDVKPILRPLSDLTKEIEVNGEKFVPMNKLYKINHKVYIYKPTNYDLEITIDTEDFSQEIDLYDGYLVMQKLLEWHFDVFGLIEQGLAIDINSLKNN